MKWLVATRSAPSAKTASQSGHLVPRTMIATCSRLTDRALSCRPPVKLAGPTDGRPPCPLPTRAAGGWSARAYPGVAAGQLQCLVRRRPTYGARGRTVNREFRDRRSRGATDHLGDRVPPCPCYLGRSRRT